jgi:peptidoglycan/LPS O-acetylase OafA/YrhL
MFKLSAWLAIGVGAAIAIAQVARNFDNLENWPMWTIDLIAAALLIAAGALALRRQETRLLTVGWSFALGLYVSALVSHQRTLEIAEGARHAAALQLVVIALGLVALSLAGLGLVLHRRQGA